MKRKEYLKKIGHGIYKDLDEIKPKLTAFEKIGILEIIKLDISYNICYTHQKKKGEI